MSGDTACAATRSARRRKREPWGPSGAVLDPDAPVEIDVVDLSAKEPLLLVLEEYVVDFLITREVKVKQELHEQGGKEGGLTVKFEVGRSEYW